MRTAAFASRLQVSRIAEGRPGGLTLRAGMSLLETTIALGILGVGLVMVAAIFPVALSQHRGTTDRARATELTTKAQAMIASRLTPDHLWVPTAPADAGQDTPWYLLPSTNLHNGAALWDYMPALLPPTYLLSSTYANVIDVDDWTVADASTRNATLLLGLDTLSDRRAPFTNGIQDPPSPLTDRELADAPSRLVWYGFYRRLGGKFIFSAAICRQQRNQLFVEQDLSSTTVDMSLALAAQNPYSKPTAISGPANARRLPVPWRVSVGYGGGNVLFNTATATTPPMLAAGLPLGYLAPRGSRIMIQGRVREEPQLTATPLATVPAGRLLTVAEVFNDPTVISVVENITDLPVFNPAPGQFVTFDVWVFPPPLAGMEFDRNSPLIEWKSLL